MVMEWVEVQTFMPAARIEAARVLARLHTIRLSDLSEELAELVRRSTPNRERLGEVPGEPPLRTTTLQHGDYFPVNFAASGDTVRILDWDLLAVGDPMWDLAFLLNVDDSREAREGVDTEAVLQAYVRASLRGGAGWSGT